MARLETRRPHNGNKHAVDIIATCKLADRLRTNAKLGARGQLLQHGVFTMSGIGHGNRRNRELTGSRNKLGSAGVDGQRRHLKAIGMLAAYIERLGADRTRAAQNGNAETPIGAIRRLMSHYSTPPIIRSSCAVMQPKMSESLRSSMPP